MKQIYKLLTIILLVSTTTILADPPYATNVAISGLLVEGQVLTGSWLYGDIDGDPESGSTYQWYTATSAAGAGKTVISGATSITYTLSGNVGDYIGFGVTPKNGVVETGAEVIVYTATSITANQAPVASAVAISGNLSYGNTLTASYTYSDNEGDPEGATTFEWFRADDASGTGAVSVQGPTAAPTGDDYAVQLADVGKYLRVQVVPLDDGSGTSPGAAANSTWRGAVLNNQAPALSSLQISGKPNKTQQLTASYIYSDFENDANASSISWFSYDNASGSTGKTAGAGVVTTNVLTNDEYVVDATEEGRWVGFEVVATAATGTFTDGTVYESPRVQILNDVPYLDATPVLTGTFQAGQTVQLQTGWLTAHFVDDDGDAESGTKYQWYRSNTASGAGKLAISGATSATYVLTNNDVGKYISLIVTPVSGTGNLADGIPGESDIASGGPVLSYPLGIVTLTAPADESVDVEVQPDLEWDQNAGVPGTFNAEDFFHVQIATDANFINIVYDDATVPVAASVTHSVTATLTNNTKYYWRVRGIENTTSTFYSPWSTIWTFTTVADITPSLSYPINSATVYTDDPALFWYNASYVTGVLYDVFYQVDGGGYLNPANNIAQTTYTLNNLPAGSTIDWYIVAEKNGTTETSATASFTIDASVDGAAIVPQPSFPIGGVAVYTLTPSLHWYLGTYASNLTYDVLVATDNGFTNVVYSASGISTLSTTTTQLQPATTYYWKVRSDNGTTQSLYSATSTFITTSSASGSVVTPIPSWPIGGPMVYSTTPTLNWYLGTYATGLTYNLEVATDAGFASIVYTASGVSSLYHVIGSALSEGTTYYWRVQSDNGSSQSAWSSVNSFDVYSSTVSTGINTPVLTYPVGGATLINTSPVLFWYCIGANSNYTYDLKYSLYPDLTSGTTETGLTDNFKSLTGLSNGVTYYWSVRAYDGSNYSDWATTESFVTPPTSTSPIVVPNPGQPTAGVTVAGNPQLSWFLPTATSAVTYDLQVSTDLNFVDNTAEIENISSTSMTLSELEAGKTYFWRVRTRDAEGTTSFYSQSAQFVVDGTTDVEKLNLIPEEFDVAQNYPNPFNPETTIRYSVPEASYVTIKVYNTLGQEVRTLLNNEVNAGVYNVRWNGEDNFGNKVASGTYIYRVTAGSNIFTKKMVLLK